MKTKITVAILILFLILLPLIIEKISLQRDFSPAEKEKLPGGFLDTGNGETYYQFEEAEGGPLLVFIHGYVSHSFIWENNYYPLARMGCGVLRYDLVGRGYSAKPKLHYDRELFRDQLYNLLAGLGIDTPVYLIALSMGGIIASDYTAAYPQQVKGVCFISPASGNVKNAVSGLLNTPLIGEYLMYSIGYLTIKQGYKNSFSEPGYYKESYAVFVPPVNQAGYKYALLSTYRNLLIDESAPIYLQTAALNRKTFLIWARDDKIVPFENSKGLLEIFPRAAFFPLEKGGHLSAYEEAVQVNKIILKFVGK